MNDVIGRVLWEVTLPLEPGKIREFARAIHDDNPIFVSEEEAIGRGFHAIPAPPTCSVMALHYISADHSPEAAFGRLGIDPARVLHGEQCWIYHRVALAGDTLHGAAKVAGMYTKPGRHGGEMTFLDIETVYRDAMGEAVVTERATMIETEKVGADSP